MDSQQRPPLPHASTTVHGGALENLKLLLIKCAMASAPAKSLSLQQRTLIEKHIQELVPTIHTPHHPTYQWMIENAIKQLNEEGGSDEEAISNFILGEHRDLPWPHTALLSHHLKRLSGNGTITKTNDGCYFLGRASITDGRVYKPRPRRITCTTSLSPSPSPSPSLSLSSSPSPSPTSSSSPMYASSDTSDSSQSSKLKMGRKKKRKCRKKRNARGSMITHPKYKQGPDRACARGWGRGRGRVRSRDRRYDNSRKEDMNMMEETCIGQVAGDICMDGTREVEILSLLTEDEATDQRKEQQSMVININMGDNCSFLSSHGRKLTSEQQGSQKVRQQRRNTHLRCKAPQTGMGRGRGRGRSRKRDLQMRETGNNMNLVEANMMEGETQYVSWMVQEDEDSMDELIDQVYDQLTEIAAEENLQRGMNQEAVNLECQALGSSSAVEIGHIGSGETIEAQKQNVIGGDYCWWQMSELGNEKLRLQKTNIQPKITPQTKDKLMEVAVEIMGPLEAAEIGDLVLKSEGEPSLSREGQIEIRDHTQMQNKMSPQLCVADDIYDVQPQPQPQGHECEFIDEQQQLQETKIAKRTKESKCPKYL